jgi:CO/xanthine dehydrogenase Mo-binding subunit
MKFGISQSIPRKEDAALLRGAGRYVADVTPPGTLHAVVLRSPHAHARLRITDAATPRAPPGVRLVLIAVDKDIAALGPMPCVAAPPDLTIEAPPAARSGAGARRGQACGRCGPIRREARVGDLSEPPFIGPARIARIPRGSAS